MKKLLSLFALIILLSCKKESNLTFNSEPQIHKELYGSWLGLTEDYTIQSKEPLIPEESRSQFNIIIEKISEKEIKGKSVFQGVEKPLKGFLTETKDSLQVTLKDAEADKNGGTYTLKIKNNALNGNWKPNKKNTNVTLIKLYNFKKRQFSYNAKLMLLPTITEKDEMPYELYVDYLTKDTKNEGTFRDADENIVTKINSSTTKLVENDLKKYKKIDLEILRNTIYARHGLIFKDAVTRQFFNRTTWYIPFESSVDSKLTPLEKENIIILQKFEKYATDNYDNFGR